MPGKFRASQGMAGTKKRAAPDNAISTESFASIQEVGHAVSPVKVDQRRQHRAAGRRNDALCPAFARSFEPPRQSGEAQGAELLDPYAVNSTRIQVNHEAIVPHDGCARINGKRRRHGSRLAND